ncbi:hypothetical protein [Tardiphaga sp. P5_C10]
MANLAESEQVELISRMSKGGDRAFQSGLIELVVHSFLVSLDHKVVLHPEIEGSSKRPDFALLDSNDRVLAYVEVTTINPASADDRKANREAQIYNAIDQANLPDFCVLGYEVIREGQTSPALKPLIKDVEEWATRSAAQEGSKFTSRFTAGDWELELDLFTGCSTKNFDNSIGMASSGVGWVAPNADLRSTLDIKGKKYGKLKEPYLIVVADAKGQLFGEESTKTAISEAVLGDEVVQWREGEEVKISRANNGFWRGREEPKNTHVCGVILFPDVGLWGLRSEKLQPILAINPWAKSHPPDSLRVLSHFEVLDNKWQFKEGKNIADILDIPNPWPPE